MYPLIIGATIAAAILAYFIHDTEEEKKEYYQEKTIYIQTIQNLRAEVAKVKREINSIYNPFPQLHHLYVESIKCADKAYLAKKKISNIIKCTYDRINETTKKMEEMYKYSKTNIPYHEKDKLHTEIAELKKLKNFLYEEQKRNKEEKDKFINQVVEFNNETHGLKEYIRDNCGYGGQIWYERKEKKIAMLKN